MDTNIIIAIILIIFAFVILIIMSNNEKRKRKYTNTSKLDINDNLHINTSSINNRDYSIIDISDLRFPYLINRMEHNHLAKAYEVIYDTFGFLDYPKKSNDELMEKEWHSWQIAILLKYLSKKAVFIKEDAKKMIPAEIRDLSKESLEQELKLLVARFYKEVDIHKSKEVLCSELNWTARDISIILMCIINESK